MTDHIGERHFRPTNHSQLQPTMSRLIDIPPDFRADLQLWPSDRSRRTGPLLPGFRGLVRFDSSNEDLDVEVVPSTGAIRPGERSHVEVRFLFRDQRLVGQGSRFSLWEGATEIGIGRVLNQNGP
jgi:hypothetical protein